MNRFLALLLLLPSTATRAEENSSALVRNLRAGKSQVVVAYGTSLTAGGAWVAHLGEALEKEFPGLTTIVNSGGSGKYSDWGVANLEARVLAKKPDTVLIEFGINDAVARFDCSVARARANLETMVERILKARPECEIVLMTMTPGDGHPEGHRSHRKDLPAYYEMYRAVAKERKLKLIDHHPNWLRFRQGDGDRFEQLVPDTIHATAEGCTEVITPELLRAFGLKGNPLQP